MMDNNNEDENVISNERILVVGVNHSETEENSSDSESFVTADEGNNNTAGEEDGNDDNDDDNNSSASDGEDDDDVAERPLPRDHSYLPSSHPLTVEETSFSSSSFSRGYKRRRENSKFRNNSNKNKNDNDDGSNDDSSEIHSPFFDLAILELNGVVLFPNNTIPVKLRDRSMIQYLGRQIDLCRNMPQHHTEVLLGIMTFDGRNNDNHDHFYNNNNNRSTARRRRRQQQQRSSSSSSSSTTREHPLIGRIGTIARITYTHERTEDETLASLLSGNSGGNSSSSQMWRRHEEGRELVFTAVGCSRFQVVAMRTDPNLAGCNVFQVEELQDRPLPLPTLPRPFLSNPLERHEITKTDTTSTATHNHHHHHHHHRYDRLAWNLSIHTPIPYFVYKRVLPWELVDALVRMLQENNGRSNLPSVGEMDPDVLAEPTKFSFWIASIMPLSEEERLDLLGMPSTYERLQFIHDRVQELASRRGNICCSVCETQFCCVSEVFTVGGAEGATANYVNEGGYIHQITTLRQVDERKMYYQGPASTQNSYFPGYSWTITYCRHCASLLGWKFKHVGKRRGDESENRPKMFFGFMSSNVIAT